MFEDEIICSMCGKLNKKDSKYCIDCGASLEVAAVESSGDAEKISDITSTKPPKMKKYKFPYKILIYFGIVALVNFVISLFIMMGFGLPPSSYFAVFFGCFLLSMLIVGIFWGAIALGGSDAVEAVGTCGAIMIAIVILSILIPVWIFAALAPIVGAIAQAIGTAISNAINNFFSQLFENIEIPGFEPFLFIGLFIALSILIVYKYHLNTKKK
ncbi:MAG: hypothetical protein ACFE9M_06265 [Promethearchaeota archaeon]